MWVEFFLRRREAVPTVVWVFVGACVYYFVDRFVRAGVGGVVVVGFLFESS